jgi:hypothetical protein
MTEKTNPSEVQAQNMDDADFTLTDDVSPQGDTVTKQGNASPTKLQVKYNGAEQEFDLSTQTEEVKALVQKGMNYDHIVSERDALKNSEEMTFLKQMAEQAGEPDVKTFIANLQKDMEAQAVQERAAQLVAEGMSARHAQQMAELEVKAKQASPQATAKNEPDIAPLTNDFQALLDEYPDVKQYQKFTDLPQEVQDMINGGKSPLVAYQKHLLNQKETQAKLDNLNAANRNRDLGSMTSPGPIDKEDPFLSGLFGK